MHGHFAFLSPIFGGLEPTYTVHLRLNAKPVADCLLVIIEFLSIGVTADELRPNIDRKSPFSKGVYHFDPKFQVEGDVPINYLRTVKIGQ